jgi:hypothetical protein
LIRYPGDPHHRIWLPFVNTAKWKVISTNNKVRNLEIGDGQFEPPSKVMQTAVTPRSGSNSIESYWLSEPQPGDPTLGYITIFYFSELSSSPATQCDSNTSP